MADISNYVAGYLSRHWVTTPLEVAVENVARVHQRLPRTQGGLPRL